MSTEETIKIGILSDSHDNVATITAAVAYFNKVQVDAVVHCGDFVAPFSLLPLKGLKCGRLTAVYGNNDGEKAGIGKLAAANGWQIAVPPLEIEMAGMRGVMLHEPDRIEDLREKNRYDFILYGHTHKPRVERRDGVLVLNPGECGGWLSGSATVATLDLPSWKAEIHTLGTGLPAEM